MGDPFTVIGGITAILQIIPPVLRLVKAVKGASGDRQRLLGEINATAALCQTLVDCADIDVTKWTETLRILSTNENGPIEQFHGDLQLMHKKLAPGQDIFAGELQNSGHLHRHHKTRFSSWTQSLKWPFTKDEVQHILQNIERQKSLLTLALANDCRRLTAAMLNGIAHITEGVRAIETSQQNDKRKEYLARLSNIDFEATHHDVASRRTAGTGNWLLESKEFRAWFSSSEGILWCRGIPGAGKTMISSLIIDHLRKISEQSPSIGVAGVYFSYKDPQSTINLLGSLLQQLINKSGDSPSILCNDQPLSLDVLSKAFPNVIPSYDPTFLVLDALDECVDKLGLIKELRALLENATCMSLSHLALIFAFSM